MKRGFKFLGISLRYLILLLVGILSLWIFYKIFASLTIYPVYGLLSLFFDSNLMGNVILVNQIPIEIINSCIAGSAYYLLLILNLSIPNIRIKKRISMIAFSFICFLFLNILRIFFLSLLFISGSSWFEFTHKLFWYLISIVFVVGIWFLEIKLFNVKGIPFYSDLKTIYNESIFKK